MASNQTRYVMLYYTQLIFIREGQADTFHAFEDQVLPLLQHHNGTLVLRVRPVASSILITTLENPYEIHLVSFGSRADFEAYRDDPQRLQHIPLKDQSVDRIVLIEGRLL